MNQEERQEFYRELIERVHELKIAYLFEEPCPLYEEDDFWNQRMTYDHEEEEVQ